MRRVVSITLYILCAVVVTALQDLWPKSHRVCFRPVCMKISFGQRRRHIWNYHLGKADDTFGTIIWAKQTTHLNYHLGKADDTFGTTIWAKQPTHLELPIGQIRRQTWNYHLGKADDTLGTTIWAKQTNTLGIPFGQRRRHT